MEINGITLVSGAVVKFKTYNPSDPALHYGKLAGLALTYDLAKAYLDIAAYHQKVRTSTNPNASALGETAFLDYKYFVIIDNDGKAKAYATEWVDASSFSQPDFTCSVFLKVLNVASVTDDEGAILPNADALAAIQDVLRDLGYENKYVSSTIEA